MLKVSKLLAVLLALLAAMPALAASEGGGLKLISFTTLLGEIATFVILIWVVMKFVWPPLMNAVETRQKEIADGLAAAEEGKQSLAVAAEEKNMLLKEARERAGVLVADGEQRKSAIVDSAKTEAESERTRILEQGRRDVESERAAMQREMEQRLGGLVIAGAAQILQREVDEKSHADIVESLKKGL